jgi:sugar lactone lactonase YvrE
MSKMRCSAVLLLVLCPALLWALPLTVTFNGVVSTLDTGSTALNHPKGVVVDNAGNIYIADTAHNQIVKVTPAGDASVLTITGLSTGLSAPERLALDNSGNLYIADTGNNRVVVVSSAGAGSVVDLGGLTLSAPKGVAIDASGNLYIADTVNDRIVKLPSGGSAAVLSITGLGTALSDPVGLGVDVAGNLYIAEAGNNRIVKVTTGGAGSALSISGLGTALSVPLGVAVDSFANVFIADAGNNRVVKVTSGGDGSVLSTGSLTFNTPAAVGVDVSGVIYVADTANSRVALLMTSAVAFRELEVGASSGRSLTLPFTIGATTTLGSVQALTLGAQSLDFTLGAGTTCTDGTTNTTCNVEVQFLPLAPGVRRGAVALFDQSSELLAVVPIYGMGGAPLAALSPGTASIVSTGGVSLSGSFQAAIDGAGNIYVSSYNTDKVVKIAAGGGSASLVSTGGYTLNQPTGVALDGAGNLYIADYANSRIVLVKSTGAASVLSIAGLTQAISYPTALAMDGAGNLYIADYGRGRIVKVTPAGAGYVLATGSYTFDTTTVTGVAVDPSGNVYIADRGSRVVKVAPSGATSLVSLSGITLTNTQGVAADGNGNLFIVDSGHGRIVQFTSAGVASVIQTPGQTLATFVFSVTVDSNGNIFIPDFTNNRVMKVAVAGAALSFANTQIGASSSDSPKTATVTNLGNEALAFSAGPTHTADFAQNTSDANLCASSTSLDPGEVCHVSVLFTPQSAGALSANLGSVAFYDSATLLGSGPLASGVATYTTSGLAAGTHSLTAVYGGDLTFLSVTSSALSLVVSDVTLNLASGGARTATVSAGGTATYHLTIAPSSGSALPAAVTLAASGGPAGATITITPRTIAAGAGATNVTVAVQVPAASAAVRSSNSWALGLAFPLGMLVLPFGIRCWRLSRKRALFAALLLMVLVATGVFLGCGSSAHPAPQQPTNYTITVTASSGSVSHSTPLTLTVQ